MEDNIDLDRVEYKSKIGKFKESGVHIDNH